LKEKLDAELSEELVKEIQNMRDEEIKNSKEGLQKQATNERKRLEEESRNEAMNNPQGGGYGLLAHLLKK